MIPLAEVGAPQLFGYCFGVTGAGDKCGGISAAFYAFPGLIFGTAFGAAQMLSGRLDAGRAIAFLLASGIANAVAVFLCVWLFQFFGELIDISFIDAPLALAGAVAGGAGGALLTGATTRLTPGTGFARPLLTASALGLLVPLVTEIEVAGTYFFYIVWQAGYAAALFASPPAGK